MDNLNNKKNNIWKILVKVIIIYVLFELFFQLLAPYIASFVWKSLKFGKYTRSFVSEVVVAIFAIVIVLIKKDWQIYKFNKKDFFKGIKLGGPILILSILFFIINGSTLVLNITDSYQNILSLVLFSIFIGIFEETFFRGIIQKELTDNYSSNYKELITSLLIAASIFGLTHLSNAFTGQAIFTTVMQIFQTFSIGLILGIIYFTTKSLWSVIFLHSFYDLSLMLSYAATLKDCTYHDDINIWIALSTIGVTLVLIIIYLAYSYVLLQKSRINPLYDINVSKVLLENDKKKKDKVITITIVVATILFGISRVIDIFTEDDDNYYVCYEYEKIDIGKYSTSYDNYDSYKISLVDGYGNNLEYSIYLKNRELYILNSNTEEEVNIGLSNIYSLIVYESETGFNILALGLDKEDYKVYYSSYLNDYYTNIEELKRSFKEYVVPDSTAIGYLTDVSTDNIYPLIRSNTYDYLIIKDNTVYVLD